MTGPFPLFGLLDILKGVFMKKFFAGVVVGALGVFGLGAAEAIRMSGGIRGIAANALHNIADDISRKKVWCDDDVNYMDYAKYAKNDTAEERTAPEYDRIMFHSEFDARWVLGRMRRKIMEAKLVTLDDYYTFCGQSLPKNSAEFKNWGWHSLFSAYVYNYARYNGEIVWEIWLPKPMYIEHVLDI